MMEPGRTNIPRRRLKDLPLIWRFMTIPLLGVVMLTSLGWAFMDPQWESIGQLESMRASIQRRLQTIEDLGARLTETYANIYQLLLDAPTLDGQAERYRMSRPHLNELHEIEDTLGRELTLIEADTDLAAATASLIEGLETTRVASTNALLVSTLDAGLSSKQATGVTRRFNDANRRFLTVQHLLHDRLNMRMRRHSQQSQKSDTTVRGCLRGGNAGGNCCRVPADLQHIARGAVGGS